MKFPRPLLACWLAVLMLVFAVTEAPAAHPSPPATQGRLELAGPIDKPVPLQGEWGFAWHRFVDPAWQSLPTAAVATVPEAWNDLTADGKPPGRHGWGSYVLQVDCPAGQSLAVEADGQRTASRLFVNGRRVAGHGEPGSSAATTRAAVGQRVPITPEFACPLRLTLHIANFDHRAGGFVRAMAVGPADVLARARESRVVYQTALLSAYLLTALVALIFFAVRPQDRVSLTYGLFCLAMAVYTDLLGERLFLRLWAGPEVDWWSFMRLEYLAWIAAMALFTVTLRGLFPAAIRRRAVGVVMALLAMGAASATLLPPDLYSHITGPGQATAIVVALVLAAALLRPGQADQADARIVLGGMLAIVVALVADLALMDVAEPDHKLAPIGFALFMLSPALVIARRMSHALNAEVRNRTLEENARLREDVERISRHDLKAPLSGILGAARLLQSDSRLDGEQRALVKLLQRAALRMLEMVNLSLHLYKMETGTYTLQPETVDLREVLARVLVDLRGYAKARGVRLRTEAPDHLPVWVRAEELLCYSILANLVKNAVEASAAGQEVVASLHRGDPVRLAVHNRAEVPPHIEARMFQKYVTSRPGQGGTGLGTYSARLMARAQQGDLQVRTGPAEGTTFTLSLQPAAGQPPTAAPARAIPRTLPPRHLLLVDDDDISRMVVSHLVPQPPFTVETAPDGQAATQAMVERWPDHVLLDMEMPLMDGLATLQWIRSQEAAHGRRRCHVVMLSGHDDEASAARALEAGADRFLSKPVDRDELVATLEELDHLGGEPQSA
ncbi:response regulator [Ramlibacter sp. AW1]|uniref:histidine kinase n=1 Tax=Ramlibacter aurantiacus TaxID=2801330 RepID=A0A937D8D4_9BURK|nr:response regulator [Ramlibacter aurantiacus]MBL0421956.1 response regulator [Ramlibacter aurantiacus]